MMGGWQRALVGAGAVAVVVGGAVLAARPWSDETIVEEAAATPSEFGVCNVSVRNVPEGVEAFPFPFPEGLAERFGTKYALVLRIPGSGMRLDPDLGYATDPEASGITINAETGEVIFERYYSAEHEAKLKAALATLRVGPWEPRGPAWPRTDTPPTGELGEILRPLRVASDYGKVDMRYRRPETGSGMVAGPFTAGDQTYLKLETCRSDAMIDANGRATRWEVAPEDEAMFQRFLDEVEAPARESNTAKRRPS